MKRLLKRIGIDYRRGETFLFDLWLGAIFIRVKDTRCHPLWFSERNGYTGKRVGQYFVIIEKYKPPPD